MCGSERGGGGSGVVCGSWGVCAVKGLGGIDREVNINLTTTGLLFQLTATMALLSTNLPCFIITVRNLMITLEQGRISTCLLPLFSALQMATKASLNTFIRTMTG